MACSVPRGRKPRKARAYRCASRYPAQPTSREAFPVHAFALGSTDRAVVRGEGAWEFALYLSGARPE